MSEVFRNYLKSIVQPDAKRKKQGIELLTSSGVSMSDAIVLEEAAFRALCGTTQALAKVLDEFPANSQILMVALAHITGSVAHDMGQLLERFASLAIAVSLGADASDLTSGDEGCDCETCVSTRVLLSQLQVKPEQWS